jgi:hypothetical protein
MDTGELNNIKAYLAVILYFYFVYYLIKLINRI